MVAISNETRDLLALHGASTALYLQKAIAVALAEGDEVRALALDACLIEIERIPVDYIHA